jgi:cytoskeletal protein CcmA (bactofilin family)
VLDRSGRAKTAAASQPKAKPQPKPEPPTKAKAPAPKPKPEEPKSSKPIQIDMDETDAAYRELRTAGRRGDSLFGRVNQRFQEVLHTNRGPAKMRDPVVETEGRPEMTADDIAMRRARTVKTQRMVVPEGVIIGGSLSSGSETEISGRVEGDVNVNGRLYLGKSALVTGSVEATSCKIDGLVEGRVNCAEELDIGETGRLNADSQAGKRVVLAGHVTGNVTTGGVAVLSRSAQLDGNIRARSIVVDEGAIFNGGCTMRPPAQREIEV